MPDRPVTERENPASSRLDELTTRELVKLMCEEDARVAPAVAAEADTIVRAIDAIAERLKEGGRLVYLGAGTSGRLGSLDASECPPTFGTKPELVVGLIAGGEAALTHAQEGAEDRRDLAHTDLARVGLSHRDVVVGISASGRTPYVLGGIERAKQVGALTIGVSCNPGSPLASLAGIAITPVPGPEVVTGSTRLKAGTATKLVLNMLSTGAMVRLGRVRGSFMVDLHPASAKLKIRAAEIVARLAGVDDARARELLAAHGNSVRAAVAAKEGRRAPVPPPSAQPIDAAALVIGIDGGGTKTEAWLALAQPSTLDLPLGSSISGCCNVTSDLEAAANSIEHSILEAFDRATRPRERVAALCVAAAGTGEPLLRERLRERLLERELAQQIAIVHDAAPLVAAGARDGLAVALIAGTGSFCFARDGEGRCARSGGLGPFLGDEGSAWAMGRAALIAAARAADGRGATLGLVRRIFDEVGTRDARRITAWANAAASEPSRVAALAPLVEAAADAGDPVAERILERSASELTLMVKTVVLKLGLTRDPLPLVLAGGVLDGSDRLRTRVVAVLRSLGVTADVQPVPNAAAGAVALARDLLAGRLDESSWFPT